MRVGHTSEESYVGLKAAIFTYNFHMTVYVKCTYRSGEQEVSIIFVYIAVRVMEKKGCNFHRKRSSWVPGLNAPEEGFISHAN